MRSSGPVALSQEPVLKIWAQMGSADNQYLGSDIELATTIIKSSTAADTVKDLGFSASGNL